MKFIQQVIGVCEGCGARAPAQRDVAVLPTGDEATLVHTPKGWTVANIHPGVKIVGLEKPFNAFGNPIDVATHFGKLTQILLCVDCTKLHVESESAKTGGLQ